MTFVTARFLIPGSVSMFRESGAKVLALANGQFDIAYFQDRTPSVSHDTDVRITRFNADGTTATGGNSIAVKAPVDNAESDGSLATLGTLQVVAFTDRTAPGADGAIRLNFYNQDALKVAGGYYGKSVLVDGGAGDKYKPEVAVLDSGNIAVAYGDGASHAIKGRIYDPALGDFTSKSFTISTTLTDQTLSAPASFGLTALSGDGFAVTWFDNAKTSHLRIVGNDGSFISKDVVIAKGAVQTDVTQLANGNLAVSYIKGEGAFFQMFNADGTPVSSAVRVSDAALTVTTTALQDGRLMVGYTASSKFVSARIYDADGTPDGDSIQITQYSPTPANYTDLQSLSTLADGRVVATYGKIVDGDVYAVILDPREEGVKLTGTSQADQYVGTSFDDVFAMGKGNDHVEAGAGNDRVDGGQGADVMIGGAGDDIYVVDNKGDVVVELSGGGNDTIVTKFSFSLADLPNVENLTITGKSDANLTGNDADNILTGNAGANLFQGGGGADLMIGGAGDDTYLFVTSADKIVEKKGGGFDTILVGEATYTLAAGVEVEKIGLVSLKAGLTLTGNEFGQILQGNALFSNYLDGKGGADVLTGGSKGDVYAFTTALKSGNVDHITNFGTATGALYLTNNDSIYLSSSIFKGLAKGVLSTDAFAANDAGVAMDASDRIIYETDTGNLYYDSNGSAAGGAVLFAVIDNHPTLTAADFMII